MATIKAFKGYRPELKYVEEVAALPYDVMSVEEAKEMVVNKPYSFLHVDKPEVDTELRENEILYKTAASALHEMIEKQILVQDTPCLYVYGQQNEWTTQYGLVCLVSAKEYDAGMIKKHENTRADKEKDRILHVTHCKAHTGPIFLTYNGLETFTAWMMDYTKKVAPLYNFVAEDGVRHMVYQISQTADIEQVIHWFKEAKALYIADGHHRAAAAAAVARASSGEEEQFFLATVFPKEQLRIMDYNRVLKDESGLSKEELFEKLSKYFEIQPLDTPIYKPVAKLYFGMRYQKKWYALYFNKLAIDPSDPVASLDVSILQNYVLSPLFKIEDPRNDKRIDFVGGIRGIEELNKRTNQDMDIAFSLFPTSIDELIKVADAGLLMPPKSTWFEPKLRSGLFIHTF